MVKLLTRAATLLACLPPQRSANGQVKLFRFSMDDRIDLDTKCKGAHLWAIEYDDMARAEQVQDEITKLAWHTGGVDSYLILLDVAAVVRHPDGSVTLNREPFPTFTNILTCAGAGFLAGLALAAPLTGAAIGALLGSAGSAAATYGWISEEFSRDVEALM